MGDLRIKSISATVDLVDRLEVVVEAHKDAILGGYNLMLFDFDGQLAFYKTDVHPSISSHAGARTLPIRWIKDRSSQRIGPASNVTTFRFQVPLSTEALLRLENFRDGGRLWARLEGSFTVLAVERERPGQGSKDVWIQAAMGMVHEEFQRLTHPIQCECIELGREKWVSDIYARLRPVDRVFIEATIPDVASEAEKAKKCLKHLAVAQTAFDEGRWEDSIRESYVAMEVLQTTMDGVAARYTDLRRDLISTAITKLRSVANPERHNNETSAIGTPDRALAEYILTSLKAAIGVVLRG